MLFFLYPTDENIKMKDEQTKTIVLSDGKPYTIRKDRSRYFYPDEWQKFFKALKPSKQGLFDFLINTGARIDEAVHIRSMDFDFDRNTVRFWKTKVKATKGETVGKPRTIPLSSNFIRRLKWYSKGKAQNDFLWKVSNSSAWNMMRRRLRNAVKDPYNFGLHNIRKTHGMWLKAINVPAEEICLRLGHDYNTYLKHYGSSEVFSSKDIIQIEKLLGDDLYARKRRY